MDKHLNSRDIELVALGAALACNCVHCVEYHIQQARKVGLSDGEIREAIGQADKVRLISMRKAMNAALNKFGEVASETISCAEIMNDLNKHD